MFGKLWETPYESMKEEQDEVAFGESTTDQQLHVSNKTFIIFFGKGTNGKAELNIIFLPRTTNANCVTHKNI
jgi:formylmethanofuran dehydrogenase subunit D